jgi:hypothetical protein
VTSLTGGASTPLAHDERNGDFSPSDLAIRDCFEQSGSQE